MTDWLGSDCCEDASQPYQCGLSNQTVPELSRTGEEEVLILGNEMPRQLMGSRRETMPVGG